MAQLTARLVGALLIGLAAATAAEAQSSIADCEKIQAADAYNQCLAQFGPTSKVKSVEPERPGDVKGSSEEAAASAGKPKTAGRRGRRGRGGHAVRHGGRQRMTISVHRRHR